MTIRVLDKKSGQPVQNVTVDDLSKYANNPQYSIDANSKIPVDIGGVPDYISVGDYNPQTMKVRDKNYESNSQKYESVGAQAQNIGRQVANAVTLGGYAVVADRFKSDAERQDAKMREEFNPIGTFVGQTLPFLIPVAGQAALGAKATQGAVGAATSALRIGEIASAGMQQGVARSIAAAAVDGAAQGFTFGVNEASLDNELSRETMGHVLFNTVLGGGAGAAVGGVVAGVAKASGSIFKGIGEKTAVGEKVNVKEKFQQDLSNVIDNASATQTELDIAQRNLATLGQVAEKVENSTLKMKEGIPPNADDAITYDIFATMATDEKYLNDVVNGKIDFATDFQKQTRYRELEKLAGQKAGLPETNPRQMVAIDLNENMESLQGTMKNFNKMTVAAEKNMAAINLDNPQVNALTEDIYSNLFGGSNSIFGNAIKTIDSYSTPNGVAKRLMEQYPNVDKQTIKTLIKDNMKMYNQGFLSEARTILKNRAAELTNIPDINVSGMYKFTSETVDDLDKAWKEYKQTFPIGQSPKQKETELFMQLKAPLYDQIAGESGAQIFGQTAVSRAQTKQIRAQMMAATDEVKKLIGQKKGDNINLNKFAAALKTVGMSQGNVEVARNVTNVMDNYLNTVKEFIPKMKSVMPEIDDSAIAALMDNVNRIAQSVDDLKLVNDKRVGTFSSAMKKLAARGGVAEGHEIVAPMQRLRMIGHDLVEGKSYLAFMNVKALAFDTLFPRVLESLTKAKTPQEVVQRRMSAINALKKSNDGIMAKIANVAKRLASNENKVTLGSITAATVPYFTNYKHDKNAKEEINKKYDEVTKNLDSLIRSPEDRIMQMDAHFKSIDVLIPNLSQMMKGDLQMKAGVLAKSMPLQTPATYGKANLTMAEKAFFIDQFEAGTNPDKMLDLISNGSITSSQLGIFQNFFPTIYQRLRVETITQLSLSENTDTQSRAKIYSIFGIATAPSVSPNRIMQEFMQQQQAATMGQPTQNSGGGGGGRTLRKPEINLSERMAFSSLPGGK